MSRYSVFSILKNGLRGNQGWDEAWGMPKPKPSYDVIIIGGGGHGLATSYYLAKNHGITNVAVIEKGWLGGGNAGRNTTIVRSNYFIEGNLAFYEKSLQLWEGLSKELNYNVMFSQRGHLNLFFNPSQKDALARRYNTMRLNGIDGELLSRDEVRKFVPHLNYGPDSRLEIQGGYYQPRAGTARHDAVNWGYARAASQLGVDIIQNCEVTGFIEQAGEIVGVETSQGEILASKIGMSVAGHTSVLAEKAGLGDLPIESHKLQAFVSEPLKPFLDTVVVYGAGHGHFYISQSDKGGLVFGGDIDGYNSYAQRGNLPVFEDVCEGGMAIMPMIGRARLLRNWGGIMDMSMDGSPIIDETPINQLYLNAGWCYGGFKATPASGLCFAHLLARGEPHKVATKLRLDRFQRGAMLDERGAGAQPNLH